MAITLLAALRIARVSPSTLAGRVAFTAVILGLAAQQTLGNLIAGMVLLSARPFRVGERVRLQAGGVGGSVEGIVSSLGLLYTTLARGEDRDHGSQQRRARRGRRPAPRARRRSTSGSACARRQPEPGPGDARRPGRRRRRDAGRPCCSRRSTATRSSCASRRRRSAPPRAPDWPTRSSPRWRPSPVSTPPLAATRSTTADADSPATGDGPSSARAALGVGHVDTRPSCSPRRRAAAAASSGADARERRAEAQAERRDVDLGAVVLDRLDDRARRRPRACGCRRPRGSSTSASANMPASRMKPGRTTETPTPCGRRSSRSASANPRRPNLVAE